MITSLSLQTNKSNKRLLRAIIFSYEVNDDSYNDDSYNNDSYDNDSYSDNYSDDDYE